MMKHIFIVLFLATLISTSCDAQPIITNANWGQSVQGVRISIDTITNVISPASVIVVNAQIENTSTNVVALNETASLRDFTVWLEDAFGKKYLLSDNSKAIIENRNFIKKIQPGEIDRWKIRLSISKEINLGEYMMKATRKIKIRGGQFIIESNPLRIKIE